MKVIQELAAYFDRRGRLGPQQLEQLLEQGLLAHDPPRTMVDHCTDVGRTYYFRVLGEMDGPVWGTDIYTGDSSVCTAAVHAGLIKPGDTAVLRVVVVEAPERFDGSLRHGVTSHEFGRYGTAFRFESLGSGIQSA
jgi:hypothetical protein